MNHYWTFRLKKNESLVPLIEKFSIVVHVMYSYHEFRVRSEYWTVLSVIVAVAFLSSAYRQWNVVFIKRGAKMNDDILVYLLHSSNGLFHTCTRTWSLNLAFYINRILILFSPLKHWCIYTPLHPADRSDKSKFIPRVFCYIIRNVNTLRVRVVLIQKYVA